MPVFAGRKCASCGNSFPFFTRPSRRVRRGFFHFFPFDYTCSSCGCINRAIVDPKAALWSWALTVIVLLIFIHTVRTVPWICAFHHNHEALYGGIAGLLAGLIMLIGISRGSHLVVVEGIEPAERDGHRAWKFAVGMLCIGFVVVRGYIKYGWFDIVLAAVLGLLIYSLYYFYASTEVNNPGQ